MKTRKTLFIVSIFMLLCFSTCQLEKVEDFPMLEMSPLSATILPNLDISSINYCGDPLALTLVAGKNIEIGNVTLGNDLENLYVTFATSGKWFVSLTHLFVGSAGDIPITTTGNPIPGKFPFQSNHNSGSSTCTFSLPLNTLPECFVVALHVDAVEKEGDLILRKETAWASGENPFAGNNWGSYQGYCKQNCISVEFLKVTSNPTSVFRNTPSNISITAEIAQNSDFVDGCIELIQVDASGKEIEKICSLNDNGNLSFGDEIKGDNVYSCIHNFNLSETVYLRVKAKFCQSNEGPLGYSKVFKIGAYDAISAGSFEEISNTHKNIVVKLNEFVVNSNYYQALDMAKTWLESLSHVLQVTLSNNLFEIKYKSGLVSNIFITVNKDGNLTKGTGSEQQIQPVRKAKVPVDQQTRGIIDNLFKQTSLDTKSATMIDNNIVIDKDVLIYEPFQTYFSPFDSGEEVANEFRNSDFGFDILHLKNQECTINALSSLTNYGFVYFDTHGNGGRWILTGQIVSPNDDYDLLISDDLIRIAYNVVYEQVQNEDGSFTAEHDNFYCISNLYISALNGTFPESIIFNNSCQSTMSDDLSGAFLEKGARAYLGFDETVHADFAETCGIEFVNNLVVDGDNVGDAFDNVVVKQDEVAPNANFDIQYGREMYYTTQILNGDFEHGDLGGWLKEGDARIVTKLGTQLPIQGNFMGIISTGLGYSTSNGGISQSFKVHDLDTKLIVNWNFLSEEFKEWIGSIYQDYFRIIIRDGTSENIVFNKTIDTFASQYNLTYVSPGIIFDQGDVFMTGWQKTEIYLSAYRGKTIQVILQVSDIGDSSWDSVVLLDDLKVQ